MSTAVGVCAAEQGFPRTKWTGSSPAFYGISSLAPLPGKYSNSEKTTFLNNLNGGHKFYPFLANIKHSDSLVGTGFIQSHLID